VHPVVFDSLTDWSLNPDERIKYYSGAAIYKTVFTLPSPLILHPSPVLLEIDKVVAMAKIRVNGQYAGGVWAQPYRLDIAPFLKDGENTIEVEVVNTWLNRIIGDLRLPEAERKVKIYNNAWYIEPWTAASPLQDAGLIGGARICRFNE
jgi:hypothetical protein